MAGLVYDFPRLKNGPDCLEAPSISGWPTMNFPIRFLWVGVPLVGSRKRLTNGSPNELSSVGPQPLAKYNPNCVKLNRSYTFDELAALLDVHKNTVANWTKIGLPYLSERRPFLILGADARV